MTGNEAYSKFKNSHKGLTITSLIDYDDEWFVLCAVEDLNRVDYDAPYYAINKTTGKVALFTPGEDFDKFFDAIDNRSVDISSFKHSDTSDYLAHHGIKGQKWGIRRFQNPDGTLTEAGRDRYQKDLANKFKADLKEIDKSYTTRRSKLSDFNKNSKMIELDRFYSKRLKPGTIYEEMHKQLSSARDELRSKSKVMHDFNTNEELLIEYKKKAAKKAFDEYFKDSGMSLEDVENWYIYDDGDQGSGNSFEIYCKETGKDYNKIVQDHMDSIVNYQRECKKVTDKLLGKYGDEVINEAPGIDESGEFNRHHKYTISEKVSKVLSEVGTSEVFYDEGYYLPE